MEDIATMLQSGVRIPADDGNFLFSIVQNYCGTDPTSCAVGTGVLSQGWSNRLLKLIIHLHLFFFLTFM